MSKAEDAGHDSDGLLDIDAAATQRASVVQAAMELLANWYSFSEREEWVGAGTAGVDTLSAWPFGPPTLDDKISILRKLVETIDEHTTHRDWSTDETPKLEARLDAALAALFGIGSDNPHLRLVFLVEALACARLMHGPEFDQAAQLHPHLLSSAINGHLAIFDNDLARRIDQRMLMAAVRAWSDKRPGKRRDGQGKWTSLAKLATNAGLHRISPASYKSLWLRGRRRFQELKQPLISFNAYRYLAKR